MVRERADGDGYIVRLTPIELEYFACYNIYIFSNCLGCSEGCTLLFVLVLFVMWRGCASSGVARISMLMTKSEYVACYKISTLSNWLAGRVASTLLFVVAVFVM